MSVTAANNPVDWSHVKYGFSPKPPNESFFLVRGKPGTGKTTFCCGFPDTVLADMDPQEGGSYVVNGRAGREPIPTWDAWQAFQARLIKDAQVNGPNRKFKAVILDPSGQMLLFCRWAMERKLGVEPGGIEGFDHGKVNNLFRDQYLKLAALGYGLFITDHLVNKILLKKGGIEEVTTEALLSQGLVKFLEQDCHHILTLKYEPLVIKTKDPKTGKEITDTSNRFHITTRPGKKTSLANPKARVWLPEVIEDLPQVGDSSALADHFTKVYNESIEKMKALTTAA